ncbi:hypothetical protein ACU8V7_03500 [Zobellia nedashkovskayae]
MKAILKTLSILVILLSFATSNGQEKFNLSVLYVGYNPEDAMPEISELSEAPGGMSAKRFKEDYKTRYPEFIKYLDERFSKVTGVDARKYIASMSEKYDVTIFDQVPPVIKSPAYEYDDNGQITKYTPAQYIEESFDHATIFMGHLAPTMGQSIGLKLDWLCMCLDAHAHHVNTEHTIFNEPQKVSLTFEDKPTPEPLIKYSYKTYPKQLPMWRVQKEGYTDGKGYRIGMVSRGNGFLDSPDAEIISNGVHTKASDAVAIGRHGNFLLWGFSASPDYMTDEAKKVFANAIVYMKQFKGKKPVARKNDAYIKIRDVTISEIVHALSKSRYKNYVTMMKKSNASSAKHVKALDKKKAKGEKLTSLEEAISKAQRSPKHINSWEEYVKQNMMGFDEQFGVDIQAFIKFLNDNREYVGCNTENKYNSFMIDEDVKLLGVSNRKIEFLETCISNLKENSKSEIANRLLIRYTNQDFKTTKEWEDWLKTNKKQLFFFRISRL